MAAVLSLLAFVAYVLVIVGLAAGITWVVVRLTPPQKKPSGPPPS
jgi:H+/Cl- antiporter ClcA